MEHYEARLPYELIELDGTRVTDVNVGRASCNLQTMALDKENEEIIHSDFWVAF